MPLVAQLCHHLFHIGNLSFTNKTIAMGTLWPASLPKDFWRHHYPLLLHRCHRPTCIHSHKSSLWLYLRTLGKGIRLSDERVWHLVGVCCLIQQRRLINFLVRVLLQVIQQSWTSVQFWITATLWSFSCVKELLTTNLGVFWNFFKRDHFRGYLVLAFIVKVFTIMRLNLTSTTNDAADDGFLTLFFWLLHNFFQQLKYPGLLSFLKFGNFLFLLTKLNMSVRCLFIEISKAARALDVWKVGYLLRYGDMACCNRRTIFLTKNLTAVPHGGWFFGFFKRYRLQFWIFWFWPQIWLNLVWNSRRLQIWILIFISILLYILILCFFLEGWSK